MELTKEHRAALLSALEANQEDAEIQKTCMDKQTEPGDHQYFEAYHWLAQHRIAAIKKALTDNEIDY